MKIINVIEENQDGLMCKKYEYDGVLDVETVVNAVKEYDTDENELLECVVDVHHDGKFDKVKVGSIKELEELVSNHNDDIRVSADFVDKSNNLKFGVRTSTQANFVLYMVDEKAQ